MTQTIYDLQWQTAAKDASVFHREINEQGWEQHVIIDHESNRAYRYPRNEYAAKKLSDEGEVLKELQKYSWPVKIPEFIEHTDRFSIYTFVMGEVLSEEVLASLSPENLESIGSDLGIFLAYLHSVDTTVALNKKTKQEKTLQQYYEERIAGARASGYFETAKKDLTELKSHPEAEQVVVHGDLHGLNIVIDPDSKRLAGIIDFSELEIGDPHQDFRKLFMTHPSLLAPAAGSYKEKSGRIIDTDKAKLWAYVNEWANACYFSNNTDNPTYLRAVSNLKKWGKI